MRKVSEMSYDSILVYPGHQRTVKQKLYCLMSVFTDYGENAVSSISIGLIQ